MGNDPTDYCEAGNYIDLTLRGGSGLERRQLLSAVARSSSSPTRPTATRPATASLRQREIRRRRFRTGSRRTAGGSAATAATHTERRIRPSWEPAGSFSAATRSSSRRRKRSPPEFRTDVGLERPSLPDAWGTSQTIFTIFPVYQGTDSTTATATSTPAAGFCQSGGAHRHGTKHVSFQRGRDNQHARNLDATRSSVRQPDRDRGDPHARRNRERDASLEYRHDHQHAQEPGRDGVAVTPVTQQHPIPGLRARIWPNRGRQTA